MSKRELSRLELLQQVERKELKQCRAAALLGISARHVKRLRRAYKADGASALVSQRRGRAAHNRLSAELVTSATALLSTRYHDFGPTLAHEKLTEAHHLKLSLESGSDHNMCFIHAEIPESLHQHHRVSTYHGARQLILSNKSLTDDLISDTTALPHNNLLYAFRRRARVEAERSLWE